MDTDGNNFEMSDENDYTLNDIVKDNQIKIKSSGNQELINVFLNNSQLGKKIYSRLKILMT